MGLVTDPPSIEGYIAGLEERLANIERQIVGEWQPVTLGAKIEQGGAFQTVRARAEAARASVRLRGACVVKAGQELKAGETLLTLPEGLRPATQCAESIYAEAAGGVSVQVTIGAGGAVFLSQPLLAGKAAYLDGVTFNLS